MSGDGSEAGSGDVFAWLDEHAERNLKQLEDYLRIPSVSTDPAYAAEVVRCCDFVVAQMRAAGLDAERIDTASHPLAYGERLADSNSDGPGAPTVLFYGHYDVQPPDPVAAWRHGPFEPTRENGRLVARGATDDKGQSFTHLKAIEALIATRGALPVNVKMIVEGEEESGGEALEGFVRAEGERLACDLVVVSDGEMYAPGRPSIVYGIRGLVSLEIVVTGPAEDLHSGTYGGGVANPLIALGRIVGGLVDRESGRVTIPGFYDDVRPLDDEELARFAALPHDEAALIRELGVPALCGERGFSYLERTWARPTCDVHGLWGGYQGDGTKTVLPASGGAKISMRLVPDQDPATIAALAERHLRAAAPPGVRVEVKQHHATPAVVMATDDPYLEAVTAALGDAWGVEPVWVRDGGSLPIVTTFADVLGAPIALTGFGLPDDRPHAPNEKIDIEQFHRGTRAIVRLFDRLAPPA